MVSDLPTLVNSHTTVLPWDVIYYQSESISNTVYCSEGNMIINLLWQTSRSKWFSPVFERSAARKHVSQSSASSSLSSQEISGILSERVCRSVCVCSTLSTWRRFERHCSTARNSWYLQETDSRPKLDIKLSASLQWWMRGWASSRRLSPFSSLCDGPKGWGWVWMKLRSLAWVCRKHRGLWEQICRGTVSRASASSRDTAGIPVFALAETERLRPCWRSTRFKRNSNVPPAAMTQPGSNVGTLQIWWPVCKDVLLSDCLFVAVAEVIPVGSHVECSMRTASWIALAYWSVCPSAGPQMTRLQGLNVVLSLESWKSTCTYLKKEKIKSYIFALIVIKALWIIRLTDCVYVLRNTHWRKTCFHTYGLPAVSVDKRSG